MLWGYLGFIKQWSFKMTTAIIGLGNMGKALAARLEGKTDLVLGTRETTDAAIRAADIVVLALPYAAALDVAANPALTGKIVVDMSNPVKPDFSGLTLGHTTSAAEEIQKVAKGAHVVKAFNTIFAGVFAKSDTKTIPVFIAGNDEAARKAVTDLVQTAGFASEDVGGLDAARLLEPLGMLNIRLGYGLGRGTDIAPTWAKL
jgi:predicted dinucleotide-binding enzyme